MTYDPKNYEAGPAKMGTVTGRWQNSSHISQMDFSAIEQRMLAHMTPRDKILMRFHLKRISLPRDDPKRTVMKEVEYMLMYGARANVARLWYINRLKELKQ